MTGRRALENKDNYRKLSVLPAALAFSFFLIVRWAQLDNVLDGSFIVRQINRPWLPVSLYGREGFRLFRDLWSVSFACSRSALKWLWCSYIKTDSKAARENGWDGWVTTGGRLNGRMGFASRTTIGKCKQFKTWKWGWVIKLLTKFLKRFEKQKQKNKTKFDTCRSSNISLLII